MKILLYIHVKCTVREPRTAEITKHKLAARHARRSRPAGRDGRVPPTAPSSNMLLQRGVELPLRRVRAQSHRRWLPLQQARVCLPHPRGVRQAPVPDLLTPAPRALAHSHRHRSGRQPPVLRLPAEHAALCVPLPAVPIRRAPRVRARAPAESAAELAPAPAPESGAEPGRGSPRCADCGYDCPHWAPCGPRRARLARRGECDRQLVYGRQLATTINNTSKHARATHAL